MPRAIGLCFLSSVLLVLAFPKTDLWFLAWIALVPFFLALNGKTLKQSLFLGFLTGVLFFSGTLYWFIHVTLPGAILIFLYLSLYFVVFAWGYFFFNRRPMIGKIFYISALWTAIEFIRAHAFSGFGWVGLGYSQYKNLPLIQMADITGVFGVSFLLVAVNVFLSGIAKEIREGKKNIIKEFAYPGVFVLALIVVSFIYGFYRLSEKNNFPQTTISIVQGNVLQEMKWEPNEWPMIMEKYLALTRQAVEEKPDLIIWPETAYPGYVWESPWLFEELKEFVSRIKTPVLLGLVVKRAEEYFNMATLLDSAGDVAKEHAKLHLVPFGEYIPLRNVFPFLSGIVPIGDFTAGKKYTLFPVPRQPGKTFSVLICFEDTVSEVARGFTKAGANLLVNITNDAWFQDTKAPFIHLQTALFRAVENRRSLVRSTNTGVSAFIDPYGRIQAYVEGEQKKRTYVQGYAQTGVYLSDVETFYTKRGDIFTYLCFGGILMGIIRRRPANLNRKTFKKEI